MRPTRWLLATLVFAVVLPAQAHKASDAYLTLDRAGEPVLRTDLALRDLEQAIGLDSDGDAQITWSEVQRREGAVIDYTRARLSVRAGDDACGLESPRFAIARHTDGPYLVTAYDVACPAGAAITGMRYRLFFDIDPLHRGLLALTGDGNAGTLVFSPGDRERTIARAPGRWGTLLDYLTVGVWHIWQGYDHLLFLLVLLLPATLAVSSSRRRVAGNVLKVVTAFTAAHSITLSLSVLGYVRLPSAPVEAAIAASIVVTALLNLWPRSRRHGWVLAFCFGLIHGLGFASVLNDLGLQGLVRAIALVGFNLGVEIGQMAVVLVMIPVVMELRRFDVPRRLALSGGSLAAAGLAGLWVAERLA